MGSCAAPSAKGDDKFITTDYLQQCRVQRSMVQTEGGRWAASARQKSVEDLCALIRRYFKESENKFINHAWQTLIRTLLNNSRTEQPNYDFKQGGDAANLLI
ncbi:hypothetical protein AB2876_24705, partial [Escherichia coli]|nr:MULTISPECIES: hypothetical protein [Enterobacteriaceae]ASQ56178.1 hypothetical protein BS654_27335 [Shigella flexneri 4c]MCL7006895.1 hypothetical protein [Escherichia coli]